jgi:prepilin-type N-terminal cleavage/methylation domain-containing protein
MKLKQNYKGQRGYTLIEMMVAITIFGVITGICGLALQQIVTVPEKGDSKADALHELQNVIHWVALDTGSAEGAAGGSTLTLTMPDNSEVVYSRSGTKLFRHYDDDAQAIARDITSLKFTVTGRSITIEVTSAPENRWGISESGTYQVTMRPAQDAADVQRHQ